MKPIKWKVGHNVWDIRKPGNIGFVVDTNHSEMYPIRCEFYTKDNDEFTGSLTYTIDGKPNSTLERVLYFSEPRLDAAEYPPFEPTLKKGDMILIQWVVSNGPDIGGVVEVIKEDDKNIYYKRSDVVTYTSKENLIVHRLGEKVEF